MLIHTLPTVITHNFHPDRGAFRNICHLPNDEAERIIASIRLGGDAYLRKSYLQRRLRTEDWLIAERTRKIGKTPLARPIYFFLGNMADGWDKSRPASIVLPLAMFDVGVLTFTFPDSMASCQQTNPEGHSGQPWQGQVFTLAEIAAIVARHGFPDPALPRDRRGPNTFIEVQVWDDRPLPKFAGTMTYDAEFESWQAAEHMQSSPHSRQSGRKIMDIRNENNASGGRYVATVDGHEAEMTFSRTSPKLIIVDHTGVPDALRGKGVGQALALHAVEEARRGGWKIIPLCPFFKAQAQRHDDWRDVVNL